MRVRHGAETQLSLNMICQEAQQEVMRDFENPSVSSVAAFMDNLETLRYSLDPPEWKRWVKADLTCRKWRYFLASDPYTRWGLVKPKGYAGDATLMDFAYGHQSVRGEIGNSGPVGSAVYALTSEAPQSQSARRRIALVAAMMRRLAESCDSLSVMSFASGHGRELELLDESTRTKVARFTAIDMDSSSLHELQASSRNLVGNLRPVCQNVLRCDPEILGSADFCYSLGLFDYLNAAQAEKVLAKMWRCLKPGGTLLVANLAPDAANLGYCEAIMDWWMTPRSEADMAALGASLPGCGGVACVSRTGCFYYLTASKPQGRHDDHRVAERFGRGVLPADAAQPGGDAG